MATVVGRVEHKARAGVQAWVCVRACSCGVVIPLTCMGRLLVDPSGAVVDNVLLTLTDN